MSKFPRAVRNLIALHSLTLESRYRTVAAHRREKGRYDVLQLQKLVEHEGRTVKSYHVVCVIDLEDNEAGMIQDILNGLEE